MIITFGKFKGHETTEVAKTTTGRSYLAWGAANLENPKWRKEFQSALDTVSASAIDINREASDIAATGDIDAEDAYKLAQDVVADAVVDEARSAAIDAAKAEFRQALEAAGVSRGFDQLSRAVLYHGIEEFGEMEKFGRVKFTDQAKRNSVWQAAIVFDGRLENIWNLYR
jgi:hypothetical protein